MKRDWNKIITECLTELYANSNPKADFKELVQFAKDNNIRDEYGRLNVHFENYEIEQEKLDEIYNSYVKKYKIKEPFLRSFAVEIYLGASPKTKYDDTKTN